MPPHFQPLRDLIRCCLFFDKLASCLSWVNSGTNSISQLLNLGDSWPFVNNFSVDLFRISGRKVSYFL